MIASRVFLNGLVTLRARFGVGYDPLSILAVILILFVPILNLLTRTRGMIRLQAFETELKSTFALNVG